MCALVDDSLLNVQGAIDQGMFGIKVSASMTPKLER